MDKESLKQMIRELVREAGLADLEKKAYIEGELHTLRTIVYSSSIDCEKYLRNTIVSMNRLAQEAAGNISTHPDSKKDFFFYCGSKDMAEDILSRICSSVPYPD